MVETDFTTNRLGKQQTRARRRVYKSGFTVQTYSAINSSFDIATLGFPAPPDAAAAAQIDLKTRSQPIQYREPILKPRAPRRKYRRTSDRNHPVDANNNWCGGVALPPSGDTMFWVEGSWQMPAVAPPEGATEGQTYAVSIWVGIDGYQNSIDVLQAGCDAEVILSQGATSVRYLPWYEWCPLKSQYLGLPVSAGDMLYCRIQVIAGSGNNSASILLQNQTTNQSLTPVNLTVDAPLGLSLAGNSAEWIVEASDRLGPLADFGPVTISSCYAGTLGGATIPVGSGSEVNMLDTNNQVLCSSTILNQTQVQINPG